MALGQIVPNDCGSQKVLAYQWQIAVRGGFNGGIKSRQALKG